jgi:hypothetical protein
MPSRGVTKYTSGQGLVVQLDMILAGTHALSLRTRMSFAAFSAMAISLCQPDPIQIAGTDDSGLTLDNTDSTQVPGG